MRRKSNQQFSIQPERLRGLLERALLKELLKP
jgi:hypothetical protein